MAYKRKKPLRVVAVPDRSEVLLDAISSLQAENRRIRESRTPNKVVAVPEPHSVLYPHLDALKEICGGFQIEHVFKNGKEVWVSLAQGLVIQFEYNETLDEVECYLRPTANIFSVPPMRRLTPDQTIRVVRIWLESQAKCD